MLWISIDVIGSEQDLLAIPTPGGVTMCITGMPGGFMAAQNLQACRLSRNVDQYQVVHVIPYQEGMVRVGVIVVGVIGHIQAANHVTFSVS
jgi:hypothetical protein